MAIVETVWDGSIGVSSGGGTKTAWSTPRDQYNATHTGYLIGTNGKSSGRWYIEIKIDSFSGYSEYAALVKTGMLNYGTAAVYWVDASYRTATVMIHADFDSGTLLFNILPYNYTSLNDTIYPLNSPRRYPNLLVPGNSYVPWRSGGVWGTRVGGTLKTKTSEFVGTPLPGFAPWDYPRQAYTIITPTKPYSSDVTVHHVESAIGASPDSSELIGFIADDKSKFQSNPLLVCNGTASLGASLITPVSTVSTGIYKATVDLTKFATITSGGVV